MWTDYIKEREGAEILETEFGFAIIKQLPDALYLQDIYIKPEFRKQNLGRLMLEMVETAAKDMGYKKVLGSCCPSANGSTISLKAILACGFELQSASQDIIFLVKEI